jgi:hypothetical protein
MVQLTPVGPCGPVRWRDIATHLYDSSKTATFDYSQSRATLDYERRAPSLAGTLTLQGLKPNFAYQIKLNGKAPYFWGGDGDDWANERLGRAGRWWLSKIEIATGNRVDGRNSNDAEYEQWRAKDFTDGTYDYVFEGYLLFGYAVTDDAGDAQMAIHPDSSFRVLWRVSQRAPEADDSSPKSWTVNALASSAWYETNHPQTDVEVYGQHEPGRALPGELVLPAGVYNIRICLSEESFQEDAPHSGEWATVLAHDDIRFTIPYASAGDVWAYNDTGTDLGTAWRDPAYDDTAWGTGVAPLGYGDSHIRTTLERGEPARHPCYYFRRTFSVADVPATLKLRVLRDDGCVVYINGAEVARSNMPAGSVTYDTLAEKAIGGVAEAAFTSHALDPTLIVPGDNVIAVEVHQASSASSDLGFDLELIADEPLERDVAVTGISAPTQARQGSTVEVAVTVRNVGITAESLTVTLTDTTDSTALGSQQINDLAPGQPAVLSFLWDTSSASLQDHGLRAVASIVAEEVESSDNVLVTVVLVMTPQDTLVAKGSAWKYDDTGTDLGTAWRAPSYDDASWASGPAQLGYGDGDEATVISYGGDASNKQPCSYFRRDFVAADPAAYGRATLKILRDDGCVAYLNGQEVARSNMPAGEITYDTWASVAVGGDGESNWEEFHVDPALLVAGTNVLAVEVHQANATSSDVSFDLELTAGGIDIVKGPYLQNVTQDSIVVMWETNAAAPSRVDYGLGGPDELVAEDAARTTIHEMQLTGLAAGATYQYRVASGSAASTAATFTTAPPSDEPFRFAAYGDSRSTGHNYNLHTTHKAVADAIAASGSKIVLNTGDIVPAGGDTDYWWPQFFGPAAALARNSVIYPTLGNHDFGAGGAYDEYRAYYALPSVNERWYAFDYGCARFICVDTNEIASYEDGSEQHSWLEHELQNAARNAIWTFLSCHKPPYTSAEHQDNQGVIYHLVPLFEQYRVHMVFSGHSHAYERYFRNGVCYIVTGGGGSSLYRLDPDIEVPLRQYGKSVHHYCAIDVTPTSVVLEARDTRGKVFDTVRLSKNSPPATADSPPTSDENAPD